MELDKELGQVLSVKDMAKLLGVSENTIRNHHERWGGIEVTPGKYRFFENVVRDKIYADIGETGKAEVLERRSDGKREEKGTTFPRRDSGSQEESNSLGKRNEGKVKTGGDPNRHGLV